MASKPVKPVLGGIPLVVETSSNAFACAAHPPLGELVPGEAEAPQPHPRRRSTSLWRRSTDDGDMLEMEYARKKLGERRGWGREAWPRLPVLSPPLPTRSAGRCYHAARAFPPTLRVLPFPAGLTASGKKKGLLGMFSRKKSGGQ